MGNFIFNVVNNYYIHIFVCVCMFVCLFVFCFCFALFCFVFLLATQLDSVIFNKSLVTHWEYSHCARPGFDSRLDLNDDAVVSSVARKNVNSEFLKLSNCNCEIHFEMVVISRVFPLAAQLDSFIILVL